MLYNYIKIALRAFRRNLSHSVINIIGLSLAITCSIAILLLVRDELSYDTFHIKGERVYRFITAETRDNGGKGTGVPLPLPQALELEFPEFEEIVLIDHFREGKITVSQPGGQPKVFIENEGLVYLEDGFFQIFDWQWLAGNGRTALVNPNSVVLSKSYAKKYFGTNDVMGKSFIFNDTKELIITGIVEDRPFNSDLPFDVMISYATSLPDRDMTRWNSVSSDNQCFLLRPESLVLSNIYNRLPAFAVKYLGEDASKIEYQLQPLADMHFSTEVSNMNYRSISKPMILAISLIAVFLLVIGCINFINLETARAIKRAKEVGIRKTLGSKRKELIFQFLGETALIVSFSMLISLGLTELLLIYLREFTSLPMAFHPFINPLLAIQLLGLFVVITLGAGFYPALVLSSYKPSEVLKGTNIGTGSKRLSLRQALVSFQFAVTQVFIVCTLITIQQINYIEEADLGFSQESIVDLPLHDNSTSKQEFIRGELDKIPGILSYTLCSFPPFSGSVSATNIDLLSTPDFDDQMTQFKMVDENYIDTYKLRLIAGEGLIRTDTATRIIINETLARNLGFSSPEEAVGEFLSFSRWELPITGIVEDFHTSGFSEKIAPVLLTTYSMRNRTAGIKIAAGQTSNVLASLESVWYEAYPDYEFEPEYLDESIKEYYEGEQKMSTLLTAFAIIAIIISGLGLYGLVSFMANQKTKEVGIRKTLGASTMVIIRLFSVEFLKLLIVGFVIAVPVIWYVMNAWLQQFEYKISIGMTVFVVGLAASGVLALTTVGYRSFQAARANPVLALKDD